MIPGGQGGKIRNEGERGGGFDVLSKKTALNLTEFGIVKGYKDQYRHAQSGKSAEGNIPVYPQVGPGY